MLSWVLRSFADRGLIEQQREFVLVIDPAALERQADRIGRADFPDS